MAAELVHAPDGRTLPLDGITIEALQQLAADDRFTDETTTEQACQHIFKADGMPSGWTDIVSPVLGTPYSSHCFRNDETGDMQDEPPEGTRSIVPLLNASRPHVVGKSNRFISHYWQMCFRSVVRAVSRKVERERAGSLVEEIYLWFDLISIDEHHAADYAKGFSTTFAEAIQQIGHVYFVAEPWDCPAGLTRIWCLWELYCCHSTGSKLSVCLDTSNEAAFVKALCEQGVDSALAPFATIDCRNAQATNTRDLDKISGEIERTVGFSRMDALVVEQLRSWVRDAIYERLHMLKSEGNCGAPACSLGLRLVELLVSQQRKAEAQAVCIEWLMVAAGVDTVLDTDDAMTGEFRTIRPGTLAPDHGTVLSLKAMLLCCGHSSLVDGKSMLRELIATRDRVSGAEHVETFKLKGLLALRLAETALFESDSDSDSNDGKEESDSCEYDNGLELREEAHALFDALIPRMETVLGKLHPETLQCKANYASSLSSSIGPNLCKQVLCEVIDGATQIYSANHFFTCRARANLAATLIELKELEAAHVEFEAVLEAEIVQLGHEHQSTLQSKYNLARLEYAEQCNVQHGVQLLEECVSVAEAQPEGDIDKHFVKMCVNELHGWRIVLTKVLSGTLELNPDSMWVRYTNGNSSYYTNSSNCENNDVVFDEPAEGVKEERQGGDQFEEMFALLKEQSAMIEGGEAGLFNLESMWVRVTNHGRHFYWNAETDEKVLGAPTDGVQKEIEFSNDDFEEHMPTQIS